VILGDCDAMFVATGDIYDPWAFVAGRKWTTAITATRQLDDALLPLFVVAGYRSRSIGVETARDGRLRVYFGEGPIVLPSNDWVDLRPGETTEFVLVPDPERNRFVLTLGGRHMGSVPASDADEDWVRHPGRPLFWTAHRDEQTAAGVRLDPSPGPPPAVCTRVAQQATLARS
jgi:hypothetical protein